MRSSSGGSPPWGQTREFLVRVIGPALALWLVMLVVGLILTRRLASSVGAEDSIVRALAVHRTSAWNSITFVWSRIGNIETVITVCIVGSGVVFWRTREWRFASLPCLAVLLQFVIFDTVSTLVGRARPPGQELDLAPPTTSYPSGHVSATTALFLSFALMAATRLRRAWLRRLIIAACLTIPVLVAFGRLYRGMHHVSDIAAGFVNGIVCAVLAFAWYRHTRTRPGQLDRPGVHGGRCDEQQQ